MWNTFISHVIWVFNKVSKELFKYSSVLILQVRMSLIVSKSSSNTVNFIILNIKGTKKFVLFSQDLRKYKKLVYENIENKLVF